MKHLFVLFLSASLIKTTLSQTITASGSVKDEAGDPVAAALVSEFKSDPAAATYTDSLGFFNFSIKKYAKIAVSCKGYNDTLVNINDNKNISVTLTKAKSVKRSADVSDNTENPLINKNLLQDAVSTQSGVNNNYVYGGGVRNYTGSLLPVFSHKEETKGSRYISDEWVHGAVTNADNSILNNPGYLYNYDKIEGNLLITQDRQSAIEPDRAKIKSFTIYVDKETPLEYENAPSVDNNHFVQIIAKGDKYKIYKLTKTKFVKSNYHTDGIATTGNPYDEYVDEDTYFSLNVKNNQMQKFSLKRKSLKEAFAREGEKLNRFFSENNDRALNEVFIKDLGNYLNN